MQVHFIQTFTSFSTICALRRSFSIMKSLMNDAIEVAFGRQVLSQESHFLMTFVDMIFQMTCLTNSFTTNVTFVCPESPDFDNWA